MASGSGQPVSGRTRGECRDREGGGGGRGISKAQSRAGLGGGRLQEPLPVCGGLKKGTERSAGTSGALSCRSQAGIPRSVPVGLDSQPTLLFSQQDCP